MKSPEDKKRYRAEYHLKNKDRANQLAREYYLNNKNKIDAANSAYARENRDIVRSHKKKYRDSNKDLIEAGRAEWKKSNPDRYRAIVRNAHTRRKRLIARQIISSYYTKELVKIYEDCPEGHHVDHIVPLRGKSVCGLHVPINLQYLPAEDNIRKSNSLV